MHVYSKDCQVFRNECIGVHKIDNIAVTDKSFGQ